MTNEKETPAQVLARKIADRMLDEKLLQPERADNFLSRLVLGKLKESDWRIETETSLKPAKPRKK